MIFSKNFEPIFTTATRTKSADMSNTFEFFLFMTSSSLKVSLIRVNTLKKCETYY